MPYFIPASLILGIFMSEILDDYAWTIPWIFAVMTFAGSLNSNFTSIKQVITHPFPLMIILVVLHIVMPLLAWGIGHLLFNGDIYTITGLILAMSIPTGITSFVWVVIYKGNGNLALMIILLTTLLSPILVPLTLSILVGSNIEMDVWQIMKGLMFMIVIPSVIGMISNEVTKGKVVDILSARLAPFSKVGMGVVVLLNGAVVAPYLVEDRMKIVMIGIVALCISVLGYLLTFFAGYFLKQDKETVIALSFTGGMRNISSGVVIATTYFPAAVAIPVVIGMLFQQILASLLGVFIKWFFGKRLEGYIQDRLEVKSG